MTLVILLICLVGLLGLEWKPKIIEEEKPFDSSIHPLLYSRQLCVNCEEYTGRKALREITRKGTCSTCGSKSIMRVHPHSWLWKQEEAVDREMAKIAKLVSEGKNVVKIVDTTEKPKKEKVRRKSA